MSVQAVRNNRVRDNRMGNNRWGGTQRRWLWKWTAAVICALFFGAGPLDFVASQALADVVYWVDGVSGNDSNTCRRLEPAENEEEDDEEEEDPPPDYTYFPCRTIEQALVLAAPGDRIHVVGRVENFASCPVAQYPAVTNPNYWSLTYNEDLAILKDITIIGGFCPGFGQEFSPPNDSEGVPTYITSPSSAPAVSIQNIPWSAGAPMQVTLEGLRLRGANGGALRIRDLATYGDITLEQVHLYNSGGVNEGAGLNVVGSYPDATSVKMNGGAIYGNRALSGGGVYVSGTASVEMLEVDLTDNRATSGNGGGILVSGSSAALTYNGGILHDNRATGNGGGIHAAGVISATIGGLTMTQNLANQGGALAVVGGAPVAIGNLYMEANQATSAGGAVYVENAVFTLGGSSSFMTNTVTSGNGGGLAVNVRSNSVFTLTASVFQGNQASADGGGLFVTRSTGTQGRFVIDGGVEFLANGAPRGAGAFLQAARVNLAGTDFTNNVATTQGGGLFVAGVAANSSVTGANFSGNSAPSGGGLYATGNIALTGPNFVNNSGTNGAGLFLTGNSVSIGGSAFFQENVASGAGGGVYLAGNAVLTAAALDAIDNRAPNGGGIAITGNARLAVIGAMLLQNNVATTGSGGGLHVSASAGVVQSVAGDFAALGNTAAQQGGAVYVANGQVQLNSGTVQSNRATNSAGGGMYLLQSSLTTQGSFTFSDNAAGTQGGGLLANQSSIALGAGLEMVDNRAPNLRGGAMALIATSGTPRTANIGAGAQFRNNTAGAAGAIYTEYVTLNLGAGAVFLENGAQTAGTGHGGAIYSVGAAQSVDAILFDRNNALGNGGALYVENGNFTAGSAAQFLGNFTLAGHGGAIHYHAPGSQLTLNGALMEGNRAANNGGALYITGGTVVVQANSQLRGNEAENGAGGALYMNTATATATFNQATVQENRAGGAGGGVYAQVATLNLNSVTLAQNRSDGQGGGLYAQATGATVQNSVLLENIAAEGGGAYLRGPGNATWTANEVRANQASSVGGGLYVLGMTLGATGLDLLQNVAQSEGGGLVALYSRAEFVNSVAARNTLTDTLGVGGGIWARNSELDFVHTTLANHAHLAELGSAAAVFMESPQSGAGLGGFSTPAAGSVRIHNSIVAGNQIGLYVLPANAATLTRSLWQNSRYDWTGDGSYPTVTANRRGDPRFFNPGQNDFRIRRESAAYDLGVASSVTTDKLGISRSQGFAPDAGAFEHRYTRGLYLQAQVSPAFVRTGETVVYTLRVRNSSAQTVNGVQLTATLPNSQPNATINGQGSCSIFCTVTLGNLAAGEERTITISAVVQGTPPATGMTTMNANLVLEATNFGPADSYGDSDKAAAARSFLFACAVRMNGTGYPTVQAAIAAAPNDGSAVIQVAGHCGDIHTTGGPGQAVTLNKNVTIQGGWNSDFTVRNPATTPSAIDAGGLGRTVYVVPGVSPTLEDINLRGGATNGLGGGRWGKDAGGGLYVFNAGITLRGVDIANSRSDDLGGGVYIDSRSPVRFENSAVRQNEAGERGGGIFLAESSPELVNMNISGNRARAGGGLYLFASAPTLVADLAGTPEQPNCRVDSNVATGSPLWRTPLGASTFWLGPGGGGGIFLDQSPATVARCSLRTNQARSGGGVYMHRVAATVQQSLLTGNLATGPILSTDGEGGGLYVLVDNPGALALDSNFFGFNTAERGSGLYVRARTGGDVALRHATIAHNLGATSLYATGAQNLNVLDSIVAFNAGTAVFAGALNGNGATVNLNRTLWHENVVANSGSDAGATVSTQNNFSGDPAFFNDGFRIKRISAAFGRGGTGAAIADRDGDARPVGAQRDLGADEYATDQFVRYVASLNGTTQGNDANVPCTDYRNPCATLQAALNAANPGDLIKMAGGEYGGVQTLNGQAQIAYIDKSVTIQGGYYARTDTNGVTDGTYTLWDWELPHPAERPTVLNAGLQGRVLTIVSPGGTGIAPRLAYLELVRGRAEVGGGVFVENASPSFEAVLVRENQADQGGGFYLRNSGGELRDLTVRANDVTIGQDEDSPTDGLGGGLYIEGGAPTVRGLTIESNIAITGAGVYLDASAAVLVQNSVVSNGGGATHAGGGIFARADTSQLLTNTVSSNQAQLGAGFYLAESTTRVQGNTLAENVAGLGGGGVYVAGGAPLLVGNTLQANRAAPQTTGRGGGLLVVNSAATVRGNTIVENRAGAGGGLYLLNVVEAQITENLVQANRADAGTLAIGGGFYVNGGAPALTLNTVRGNVALRGGGGAVVCVLPECVDARTARAALTDNLLEDNRATEHGGGLFVADSAPQLVTNTFAGNQTAQGNGGGIYLVRSTAQLRENLIRENLAGLGGGGIYLLQDGALIVGGEVRTNRANSGAGIYLQNQTAGTGSTLVAPEIRDVLIVDNRAAGNGGGVYANQSRARLHSLHILDNQAVADGGGVYLEATTLRQFESNLVAGNRAGGRGGGVVFFGNSNTLAGSNAIVDNTADSDGGGIAILGASPTLAHTTLARNVPNGVMLAVANNVTGVAHFYNSIIVGHDLGVRTATGMRAVLDGTLFDGNQANTSGPANTIVSTNEVAGAPGFATDGYRLLAGSAALDAGARLPSTVRIGDDIDGQARVQGGGPDLGAHELPAPCAAVRAGNLNTVYASVQAAIDAAGPGAEIRLAGTCTGLVTRNGRTQLAYVDKNLTLRGGYLAGAWNTTPDPERYPTVLDARSDVGTGRTIYIAPNTLAVLENLVLYAGDATGQGGGPDLGNGPVDAGGNLMVDGVSSVTVRRVDFRQGRAAVGGGLYVRANSATLATGEFVGNVATLAGGGFYVDGGSADLTLRDFVVRDNRAPRGGGGAVQGGQPTISGNEFAENVAESLGVAEWGLGGGLFAENSSGALINNRYMNNQARLGGALYTRGGLPVVFNNMAGRNAAEAGSAFYLVDSGVNLRHNTLVDNVGTLDSASTPAVVVRGQMESVDFEFANNIVVGHGVGLAATGNSAGFARANIWFENQTRWEGSVSEGQGNRSIAPGLRNRAGGDYFLADGSPAIDQGVNAGVSIDILNRPRPGRLGYDIGAHEFLVATLTASLAAVPNPVGAGQAVGLLAQVVNTGDVDLVARIVITLPTGLTSSDPLVFADVALGRGETWSRTIAAQVGADRQGTFAAQIGVSTDQGIQATAAAAIAVADTTNRILDITLEATPSPVPAGSEVQYRLRVDNSGGVPLDTIVRVTVPPALTVTGPLTWTPTIAGPDGAWTTLFTGTVAADAPDQLPVTVQVISSQGPSAERTVVTELAKPAIGAAVVVEGAPGSPPQARSGAQLTYRFVVTNTGNVPLNLVITPTLAVEVAPLDPVQAAPYALNLPPGGNDNRVIPVAVETGYEGTLTTVLQVTAAQGATARVEQTLPARRPDFTPTKTAAGGIWHDPAAWSPSGVPTADDWVLIPEGVVMIAERPVEIHSLRNRGELILRGDSGGGVQSQQLKIAQLLENFGVIRGTDAATPGAPGTSVSIEVDIQAGSIYNEGTIRAGNGAADGGDGGVLRLAAGSMTNNGTLRGGAGADVTRAGANVPGGQGGGVFVTIEPGQMVNRGLVVAGNGGAAHPDADPPQAGGRGGDIVMLATSIIRLDGSELRAGAGGAGTTRELNGAVGQIGIGAVRVSHTNTNFSRGDVSIVESGATDFSFSALGPSLVLGRVGGGEVIVTLRVFNRSARQETYLITPLRAPTGWQFLQLPATLTVPAFKSAAIGVRMRPPAASRVGAEAEGAAETAAALTTLGQRAALRITAQRNAGLRNDVEFGIVASFGSGASLLYLPQLNGGGLGAAQADAQGDGGPLAGVGDGELIQPESVDMKDGAFGHMRLYVPLIAEE